MCVVCWVCAQTLGCIPIADGGGFVAEKLGEANLVEEESTPSGKIVKVTGVKHAGKTVTVLVRGSNRLVIDEAERSVHDALCVVRSLVKQRYLMAGGGAPEAELALSLSAKADELGGVKGFCIKHYARAMEVIPTTLAENAGLHPIQIVTELRKQHAAGKKTAGINVKKVITPATHTPTHTPHTVLNASAHLCSSSLTPFRACVFCCAVVCGVPLTSKGEVTDILEENVLQPLLVSTSAITLATECVRMLLKIDDIVAVR